MECGREIEGRWGGGVMLAEGSELAKVGTLSGLSTMQADKLRHMLTKLTIAVALYRQMWKQKATYTHTHAHAHTDRNGCKLQLTKQSGNWAGGHFCYRTPFAIAAKCGKWQMQPKCIATEFWWVCVCVLNQRKWYILLFTFRKKKKNRRGSKSTTTAAI